MSDEINEAWGKVRSWREAGFPLTAAKVGLNAFLPLEDPSQCQALLHQCFGRAAPPPLHQDLPSWMEWAEEPHTMEVLRLCLSGHNPLWGEGDTARSAEEGLYQSPLLRALLLLAREPDLERLLRTNLYSTDESSLHAYVPQAWLSYTDPRGQVHMLRWLRRDRRIMRWVLLLPPQGYNDELTSLLRSARRKGRLPQPPSSWSFVLSTPGRENFRIEGEDPVVTAQEAMKALLACGT
jgi:hypothetical protein